MEKAEIGLIGLGVMGSNLALNIAEKGHRIAVFNRTDAAIGAFVKRAGDLAGRIEPCRSLDSLVRSIRGPRPIILMIPAGDPVDQQIEALKPLLDENDILIDAGNANFHDTVRRMAALSQSGPQFLGVGVSGGEEGARHGPSIMAGGPREAYDRVEPVLTSIAARFGDEPCSAWVGPGGAGHFVKTIHNGIEYADMQMIAEIYGIMRDSLRLSPPEMAEIFAVWNRGRLNSYLIEITASVLGVEDAETGGPLVDVILDRAGQKGTGRWAAIEAQMLAVPATCIEAAVAARSLSAMKETREEAQKLFDPASPPPAPEDRTKILAELEHALLAGKIAAYAQGFAVMAAASRESGWQLPLATVARIWRAGCIIRSAFLDEIAKAFDRDGASGNLMLEPEFTAMMKSAHPALRITVGRAALAGLPVPALSAALAYFDGFRQARGTANLIQAQRDFFGAHGFERIDAEGAHHGVWNSGR